MPYYKALDNSLHFLDSADFENMLPPSAVKITDKQAAALMPKPEPVRITRVSMRQARLALLQAGLLSGVQGAIDTLESPAKEAAQIEWEYATEVNRESPLVAMLAPALGLTEEQMDQLFTVASGL